MKYRIVLAIIFFSSIYGCKNSFDNELKTKANSNTPNTIMAIFAHPDDETAIGPVLSKYGSIADLHVVLATDGRYGVTDHFGIPAGDALVNVRKQEMECACQALGVNPPHFLGAKDGLGLNGKHNFYAEVDQLKKDIEEKIIEVQPDVILTYGPDGDTGHPDHRMVGLLTTEILLRENWVDSIDLYYFSWIEEQTKKFPEDWGLGWTHPDLLDTKITFTAEQEEMALNSILCHKSQFTVQEHNDWIQAEKDDSTNILYFRKFALASKNRMNF